MYGPTLSFALITKSPFLIVSGNYLYLTNARLQPILNFMRLIVMMTSILIVSLLIFKGYSSGIGNKHDDDVTGDQIDPLKKAGEVNQLIQDASNIQRQELEKQIQ